MHGSPLPAGLLQSQQLPEPVFTPSTKATVGHDENISFDQAASLVGAPVAAAAREFCVDAYRAGAARAAERGASSSLTPSSSWASSTASWPYATRC